MPDSSPKLIAIPQVDVFHEFTRFEHEGEEWSKEECKSAQSEITVVIGVDVAKIPIGRDGAHP
jgi:hypothetical protein